MCGIVGALAFGESVDGKTEKIRQESMIFLATELLQLTRTRGEDATGVATLFSDGNFYGIKMGIPSPDFIARFGGAETDYDGFLKVWRDNLSKRKKYVKSFLGHCRKTSVGHANDNTNNHPIQVGDVLGVHNGTLTNHDEIFKMLKCERHGDVDSEAIVRLLHHLTKKGKDPFTTEVLMETCKRLHGTYSCIMVNGNSPNQVATFRDSRPAEAALIKPLGIVLLASEATFLKNALFRYQKMSQLYPTSVKFPLLGKGDIDMRVLSDDNAYLWDLSIEVNKKTELPNLCQSEKIPRTGKLWAKTTTTTSYSRFPNQQRNWANDRNKSMSVGNKKTEVDAKPATGAKDSDTTDENATTPGPRVWNKGISGYEKTENVEGTKKIGTVEIDVATEGGSKTLSGEDISTKAKGDDEVEDKKNEDPGLLPLKVVEGKAINTLVGDPIKIISIPFPEDSKHKDTEGEVTEININKIDPKGLKKANEVAENLAKFENDDEVIASLDANPQTLKEAPLYALANRIVKTMFTETFALGYTVRKNEEIAASKKKKKRDRLIMSLKEAVVILSEALSASKNLNYTVRKELIDRALIDKLNRGEANNISIDTLSDAFSVGDLKRNRSLRLLRLAVMGIKEGSKQG